MAKDSKVADLARIIDDLQAERQAHVEAIERIDEMFRQYGIEPEKRSGRGRRRGAVGRPAKKSKTAGRAAKKTTRKRSAKKGPGRRGGRRSYKQTAEEFITSKLSGGQTLTTGELKDAWKKAGRAGTPDNTLSKMARQGQIKRENIPGARGSKYSLA